MPGVLRERPEPENAGDTTGAPVSLLKLLAHWVLRGYLLNVQFADDEKRSRNLRAKQNRTVSNKKMQTISNRCIYCFRS